MNATTLLAMAAVLLVAGRLRPRPRREVSGIAEIGRTRTTGGRHAPPYTRTHTSIPAVRHAAAAITVTTLMIGPVVGMAVLGATLLARRQLRHRGDRRVRRAVDVALPDAIDLFVITVHAGFTPRDALARVVPVIDPTIAAAFSETVDRCRRGERFAEAVSAIPERLGPAALTFADTLAEAARTGLPIGSALGRLADDARHHRRRAAEAAARELPVRLSLPLVLCTLPSFVLVAIVPLLLGTLSSIRTPG